MGCLNNIIEWENSEYWLKINAKFKFISALFTLTDCVIN